jgi:hypothetical protein
MLGLGDLSTFLFESDPASLFVVTFLDEFYFYTGFAGA